VAILIVLAKAIAPVLTAGVRKVATTNMFVKKLYQKENKIQRLNFETRNEVSTLLAMCDACHTVS
jgi:hypothetical protein